MAVTFNDKDPGPDIRRKLNELGLAFDSAIAGTMAPSVPPGTTVGGVFYPSVRGTTSVSTGINIANTNLIQFYTNGISRAAFTAPGTFVVSAVTNQEQNYQPIARSAVFNSGIASWTGAIKIKLPIYKTNQFVKFIVTLYSYSDGGSFDISIAGYCSSQPQGWINPSVAFVSAAPNVPTLNVRFGEDATTNCVWIGETTTVWPYPKTVVHDVLAMTPSSGSQLDVVEGSWAISVATTFDTVQIVRQAIAPAVTEGNQLIGGIKTFASPVNVNGGVQFPATQVSISNPNILDDYEEGTFTPTAYGATTAGTGTFTTQNGLYTKVGDLVFFTLAVQWTGHTGTGALRIGPLPFTALITPGTLTSVSIYSNGVAIAANNVLGASVLFNTNYVNTVQTPVGGGNSTNPSVPASGYIVVSGSYKTTT